jgi:hypothetical protein
MKQESRRGESKSAASEMPQEERSHDGEFRHHLTTQLNQMKGGEDHGVDTMETSKGVIAL